MIHVPREWRVKSEDLAPYVQRQEGKKAKTGTRLYYEAEVVALGTATATDEAAGAQAEGVEPDQIVLGPRLKKQRGALQGATEDSDGGAGGSGDRGRGGRGRGRGHRTGRGKSAGSRKGKQVQQKKKTRSKGRGRASV